MAKDGMAALAPAFPKKRGAKKGSKQTPGGKKKVEVKSSVDPGVEGYTPRGAMRGGGSTTKGGRSARARRLAGMPV